MNRSPLVAGVVVSAVWMLGMIRFAGLVQAAAVNLLFEDQWDLLRPLFDGSGWWTRFDWQHGPHRQGLGGLVIGWIYGATHWDVRAEAWVGVGILGAAAVLVVGLSARLRGRLAWSDTALPLLILAPVHWETLLLTPNIAHSVLPLFLILLLGHALLLSRGTWRRAVAVVGAFAACLFTGFALCAAVIALPLIALECFKICRGRCRSLLAGDDWRSYDEIACKQAPTFDPVGSILETVLETKKTRNAVGFPSERARQIIVLGAMLFVVVLFGYNYRWEPAVPGWTFPVTPWTGYPRFVALMYTSVLGWREITIASTAAGVCLLLAVLAAFVLSMVSMCRGRGDHRTPIIALLTGTSLCYGTLTAVGRLPINIEAAFMWRYTTLMLPGLCGLILAAERWVFSRQPLLGRGVGLAGIALALVVWCNFKPERQAIATAEAKRRWVSAYLRTHDLAAANRESDFFVYLPAPESTVIKQHLDYLEAHHLSFFRDRKDRADR